MKIPSKFICSLIALGAVLSGCSCGKNRPAEGKSVSLPSAGPTGTFTGNYKDDPQVKCDASRNCTMTFKDGVDAGVTWSVDFTLDSSGQSTTRVWREL